MPRDLKIFLVRHGQTAGSREGRFCGTLDLPLDEKGRAMAEALGDYYARWPWAGLYASPLLRTRETAAPLVRRTGLELQLDAGLREIEYGAWEGLLEAEVRARTPDAFEAWLSDPGRVAPPGGETGLAIAVRALAALERIRAAHPDGGEVLIVSHKATLRILACSLLGIDVSLFRARLAQPAGSMTVFELKSTGPLLLCLADARHLPPELISET